MPALPVTPPMTLAHVVAGPPEMPWDFHYTDPATEMEYSCPATDEFRARLIAQGIARESDFRPRFKVSNLTPEQRQRLRDLLHVPPSPHLRPMNTSC